MIIVIWSIVSAAAGYFTIRNLTGKRSVIIRNSLLTVNIILSAAALFVIIRFLLLKNATDTPRGIMTGMLLNLSIISVLIPQTILALLYLIGRVTRLLAKKQTRPIFLSFSILWGLFLLTLIYGWIYGRHDFRYENVNVGIEGLHADLQGLKIIHLSDLHLGSFHGSEKKIVRMAKKINDLEPDFIMNTGDFITLGHREFGEFDTILVKMVSKYGNFAVLGNHDIGTYLQDANQQMIKTTILNVSEKIRKSGYTLLDGKHIIVEAGRASIAIIGAETRGRHPVMVHPDIAESLIGTDSAQIRILLSHDPNHWDSVIDSFPQIELTLAGHTHGMQFGILGKNLKWSPSKYSYPRWYGLYKENEMQLYVNRGLGVLGIPVRTGMPPEITIITLTKE